MSQPIRTFGEPRCHQLGIGLGGQEVLHQPEAELDRLTGRLDDGLQPLLRASERRLNTAGYTTDLLRRTAHGRCAPGGVELEAVADVGWRRSSSLDQYQ